MLQHPVLVMGEQDQEWRGLGADVFRLPFEVAAELDGLEVLVPVPTGEYKGRNAYLMWLYEAFLQDKLPARVLGELRAWAALFPQVGGAVEAHDRRWSDAEARACREATA